MGNSSTLSHGRGMLIWSCNRGQLVKPGRYQTSWYERNPYWLFDWVPIPLHPELSKTDFQHEQHSQCCKMEKKNQSFFYDC